METAAGSLSHAAREPGPVGRSTPGGRPGAAERAAARQLEPPRRRGNRSAVRVTSRFSWDWRNFRPQSRVVRAYRPHSAPTGRPLKRPSRGAFSLTDIDPGNDREPWARLAGIAVGGRSGGPPQRGFVLNSAATEEGDEDGARDEKHDGEPEDHPDGSVSASGRVTAGASSACRPGDTAAARCSSWRR